ncbi:MAG: tetratricopeptide repeat protein, partial [Bryobacteraceae bacterium]
MLEWLALLLRAAWNRVETLKHAAALIAQHRFSAAEAELQSLLSRSPGDALAMNLLGVIKMEEHDRSGAEQLFRKSIAAGQRIVGPRINLAALYGAAQPKRALEQLQASLSIDPENRRARALVRQIAKTGALGDMRSGKTGEALSLLEKARKILPDDPEILYDFGMTAFETAFYPDAQAALQKSLRLRPAYHEAQYALARVYLKENRPQQAENEMRLYLAAEPKDASAQYGLGYILLAEQKLKEAKAAFERSLALEPSQTESLFELGRIAQEQGHTAAARAAYSKVVAADPHHAGALAGLGIIAFRKAKYREAKRYLRQSVAAAHSYRKAHYYLALALSKSGEPAQAQKEFQIAKQLQKKPLTNARL